jgi:hypothetical protein
MIYVLKNLFSTTKYNNTAHIYVHSINICNAQARYYFTTYRENLGTVIFLNETSPGKWISLSTVHITPETTR